MWIHGIARFTQIGPPLGALFASINLFQVFPWLQGLPINSYSSPALFALILIVIETTYMYFYLPETIHFKPTAQKLSTENKSKIGSISVLSALHFTYLFFFSGMEFTLTFLTFDIYSFSHLEQGKLLGFIGIITALVQGGYVRRVAHKTVHEKNLVVQGILSCAFGLFLISAVAYTRPSSTIFLYVAAAFLAFTSGTVVSSLTALASFAAGGRHGEELGKFRAYGQLGRSFGPGFACILYWVYGGAFCYGVGGASVLAVAAVVALLVEKDEEWEKKRLDKKAN